jgi:hypothetical protein
MELAVATELGVTLDRSREIDSRRQYSVRILRGALVPLEDRIAAGTEDFLAIVIEVVLETDAHRHALRARLRRCCQR